MGYRANHADSHAVKNISRKYRIRLDCCKKDRGLFYVPGRRELAVLSQDALYCG